MRTTLVSACVLAGCATDPPAETPRQFFDRNVAIVLEHKCSGVSGCHDRSTEAYASFADPSKTYDAVLWWGYEGDFTDQAPIVTAHPEAGYLNAAARGVIDQWLVEERLSRY